MRTLVIVPTHNEGHNIAELLDRLFTHVPEANVMVIDDASSDATRAIVSAHAARNPHIDLIERPVKTGLGDAYLDAFHRILTEGSEASDGDDVVAQIDADLSHDPAALPLMIEIARRGVDVVIGSRYVPGGHVAGWPRRRTWLSRWGNRYAAIALGLAINDATAGLRVYRADALRRLDLDDVRADGYGFQIEMTYRAVVAGLSIVEVPTTFRDRVAGESKMSGNIVREAFALVTLWGLVDLLTFRRRRRAYGPDVPSRRDA